MQILRYPLRIASDMILCMKFPEFGNQYSFPAFEDAILKYWKDQRVFQRVLENKENRKEFGFYDGPPFATGTPHYGHLLAGTIKDMIPRYWTMRGYHCERRFGWDTHGLPVEYEMEKKLELNGSPEIREYGIGKFNEACRGIVLRYTEEWREVVERMGRWVDLDNDYKTMNPEFMESIWWVFKELWDKNLIYLGKKVVPYSWRITAPLSNFEAGQNYKSVQDPAVTVTFPLSNEPSQAFVAWTTTPWTLPSNLALAVNPKLKYARVALKEKLGDVQSVWLAEARLEAYEKEVETEILESKLGSELVDAKYSPLFDFFLEEAKATNAFRVLGAEFVTDSDGTGFVHTAPAFGEDDFFACQKAGIDLVDPTDENANFTSKAKPYERMFVKDADKEIVKDLKSQSRLLKQAVLQHNYPFCYRSDTPLIYKAISSWFVNVEAIKDRMIEHNKSIHWVPGHLKEGRFGKWLENARDWCISRNRFWGTPIPVWQCSNCDAMLVIGSREELNRHAGKEIDDLHSHHVDELHFDCGDCGKKKSMTRTPEVLDCWFESGSMPYAQLHYPFENQELFKDSFPADFIAEGLDQTRGWFYTLTVLSAALFDKPAFRNCVVNGMVLAEDGKKMSKSLKNYPDPKELIGEYGADAIRLYFMQSGGVHGEELRFSKKLMVEQMRAVMLPIWNAYGFFASYANIDGFQKKDLLQAPAIDKRPQIDRWILAKLKQTEEKIHATMEDYNLSPVSGHLVSFIDDLTNWYVRLNRGRFWAEKGDEFSEDKLAAYATLWDALETFSRLLAPYLPFFSESLYGALNHCLSPTELAKQNVKSVHEEFFPLQRQTTDQDTLLLGAHMPPDELDDLSGSILSDDELKLVSEMEIAQRAILLGRSLRADAKIGLRQPLEKISFAGLEDSEKQNLKDMEDLVLRELNLKEIDLLEDGSGLVEESVKPNLPRLGPRVGKNMGKLMKELKSWGSKEIAAFEAAGKATVADLEIEPADLLIERKAKAGKCAGALSGLVAELATDVSDELLNEGLQRELVNRIQQRRKAMDFNLSDRISVRWTGDSHCQAILKDEANGKGYISQEVLATKWEESSEIESDEKIEIDQKSRKVQFQFDLQRV